MDALPVLSQAKSLVQLLFGQLEQAKATQVNFSRQCPIVSQVRSLVELIKNDKAAARETQAECGRFIVGLINNVPVVGHINGGIRYSIGDTKGGNAAVKAATRTTAVIAAGVGGFLVAGPVGACSAAMASGAVCDSVITVVDTKVNGKFTPYGVLEPFDDPTNAGKWFDAVAIVAFDGLTGRATGKVVKCIKQNASGGTPKPIRDVLISDKEVWGAKIGSGVVCSGYFILTKLEDGIIFILKDNNLVKVKQQFCDFYYGSKGANCKENSTVPMDDDLVDQDTIRKKGLSIDTRNGTIEVTLDGDLIIVIERGTTYRVDAQGNKVELEEDAVYFLSDSSSSSKHFFLERDTNKGRADQFDKMIENDREGSIIFSDGDTMYYDAQQVLDDEEDALIEEREGLYGRNSTNVCHNVGDN